MKRSLIIIAVAGVLLIVALVIGIAVVAISKNKKDATCYTPGCIHTAAMILENMNPEIDPCDNFYEFTCGGFLQSTTIAEDESEVNSFSLLTKKVQKQLKASIEEPSRADEKKPFTLVKNLYRTCMNTTAIEKAGLEPLHEIIKQLGKWPVIEGDNWKENNFSWDRSVYRFRQLGYSMSNFIDFGISADPKNSTKRIIMLDQALLSISREYLVEGVEDPIIKAYFEYMVDISVILGANKRRAVRELKESLEFEIRLANISLPEEKRRNFTLLNNPMTIAELTRRYSSIPWVEYINNLLPPPLTVDADEVVILLVPSYISSLEKLLRSTPKRVQANYIVWRAVGTSVKYLTERVRKRQLAFYTAVDGATERKARWRECIDIVSELLSVSTSALYVRKHFKEDAKNNAIEMTADIRKTFTEILQNAEWMDEGTRKRALEKAASVSSHIGYPDELLDDKKLEEYYADLELSPDNFIGNILNLTLFDTEYSLGELRKPINKSEWITHSQITMVNAFYELSENSLQIPAGILQGVFFNHERPRYMNYGSIGFVIGHELTHGFDTEGSQYDTDGNLVDWWAPETKKKYLKNARCIIYQYGNYTVKSVGLKLNGINTQGENIADNGGIKEAYLAYAEWVKRNGPEPKLPGLEYTPEQMFWISAGNNWCTKHRPESLKLDITTDEHSPGEFRILGTLSNRPEFATDFKCPAGSTMNPVQKCSVW